MAGRPKGLPRTGGRKAGTPNKLTKTIKAAIEEAFDKAGGADYLATMAIEQPAAIIHDAPGITVHVASEFQRSWIEDHFRDKIGAAAREVIGSGIKWVRFEIERNRGKA